MSEALDGAARRVTVLLAILATIVVACADGRPTATPPATGASVASGVPTSTAAASSAAPSTTGTAPVATPSEMTKTAVAARPLVTIPAFDLGTVTEGLDDVDSYRTSFKFDGAERYSSIVVTKPAARRQITFVDGGQATTVVEIGEGRWVRSGDDPLFLPVPLELASAMLDAFDPTEAIGTFSPADWAGRALDLGAEDKNGVAAHHYRIDPASSVGAPHPLGPGASIDIWIADEGYPVAWESTGFGDGDTVSIQVTNVDDPSNIVEEPN